MASQGRTLAWGPDHGSDLSTAQDLSIAENLRLLVVPVSAIGLHDPHLESQRASPGPGPLLLEPAECRAARVPAAAPSTSLEICSAVLQAALKQLGEGRPAVLACCGGTDRLPACRKQAVPLDSAAVLTQASSDGNRGATESTVGGMTWAKVLQDRAAEGEDGIVLRVL